MHDATRVIRAGLSAPAQGRAFLPGPTFAAPFHAAGDPAASAYTYGRFHNPTWAAYEAALSELEEGPTVVFASGMAAVTAVLGTVLRHGDLVMLPADSYYTTRVLADNVFQPLGVEIRLVPTAAGERLGELAGVRLLWLESPTNPGLEVCDIRQLAATAHGAGAFVAVDNTTATVLGQRPLALGADFSVASDTKALTGHSDLILGHVAVRDAAHAEALVAWRTRTGAVPGPMEVWLAHRSLGTLHLRLERQCANALAIAEALRARPEVVSMRYPGLPGDPAHLVACSQMSSYGPVVSFALADQGRAERFLAACTLVYEATSFGGLHTTAERRARWGGDIVPGGFIRLSAGCEDSRDLVADLMRALTLSAA